MLILSFSLLSLLCTSYSFCLVFGIKESIKYILLFQFAAFLASTSYEAGDHVYRYQNTVNFFFDFFSIKLEFVFDPYINRMLYSFSLIALVVLLGLLQFFEHNYDLIILFKHICLLAFFFSFFYCAHTLFLLFLATFGIQYSIVSFFDSYIVSLSDDTYEIYPHFYSDWDVGIYVVTDYMPHEAFDSKNCITLYEY